jgi:adenylosuccinate lyase
LDNKNYQNPLIERYASEEMSFIFSPDFKFRQWRQLWVDLAESEKELGLKITGKQIAEMKKHKDNIDFKLAAKMEKKFRHDVMAHVHTFAKVAPSAAPIIHLGATSAYVGDNTDQIQLREALKLTRLRLVRMMQSLSDFAEKTKNIPCLGFTHFQSAQLTTVGKRACLWLQELLFDLQDLNHQLGLLRGRGVKGTTGTQASFLALFEGDSAKVEKLDQMVAQRMGFEKSYAVTGQTVSRKIDARALSVLSGIGQSAHRIANDWRLLAHLKEVEEPFEKNQIGSSAMAYKRNPMRSERITALSRYVINMAQNPAFTAATQWFERTLDDSANKRLSVPEAFLATDSILLIMENVVSGLVVNEKVIERRVTEELPFMATENIMMAAVKKGGDRQELHEVIRVHSHAASKKFKEEGGALDLIDRLKADKNFDCLKGQWEKILNPKDYIGRAPKQASQFISKEVKPALKPFLKDLNKKNVELKV